MRDVPAYSRRLQRLVENIRADYESDLRLQIAVDGIATDLGGDFRSDRVVMKVREQFTAGVDGSSVVEVWRYTFLKEGDEVLRLETDPYYPPHAHFPKAYLSNTGRHFLMDRWGEEFQDMNFITACKIWSHIVRERQIPEPFYSASGLKRGRRK